MAVAPALLEKKDYITGVTWAVISICDLNLRAMMIRMMMMILQHHLIVVITVDITAIILLWSS